MVSKEQYVIGKMRVMIQEHLKENRTLTGVFMMELKSCVELWASEHDNKFRVGVSLGESEHQKEVLL